MIKANDKIKVHMYSNGKEIQTRSIGTVFTVYERNGKLGIDWADEFAPFDTFAYTVIFENVETKEQFYFSNIKNAIVKVES